MRQEIAAKERIIDILYLIWRSIALKNAHKKKKKTGLAAWLSARPFALLAFVMVIMMLALLLQLPRMSSSIDRQREQLTSTMAAYSEKQSERNVLASELERVNSKDYIETIARREHGYGWYGETIYEVANLSEIQAQEDSAE